MKKATTRPKGATRYIETAFGILPRHKLIELLRALHKQCFGFIFPEWAGTLRRVDVQVSDYTPPAPHKLREFLFDFERDLAEQLRYEELISVAAWMQHRIVWIHPFLDYNGRIARLATNLLFLEHGLPLVEIPAEKSGTIRDQYIAAMQAGDQGDTKPLEALLQRSLKE